MAVTGKFEADFAQFDAAVEQSTGKLRVLEGQAALVGPVVDRIGAQAPSAFGALITSADGAGTAIQGLGAEAETAEQWLARTLATTKDLNAATTEIVLPASTARGALADVGEASGFTFETMGKLGSAMVAGQVLMASFSLTSTILEFTGLDKAIGDATVRLWDFGRAEQVSGAQQDVVTRAIERGADATITYADALKFNDEWLEKLQARLAPVVVDTEALAASAKKLTPEERAAAAEAEKWAGAMAQLDAATVGWQATLDTMSGDVVESIKFYLQAGVAQGSLATAFGVTAEQVKAVSQAMRDEATGTATVEAETTKASTATDIWNSGLTFTAETIATAVVPALDAMAGKVRTLSGDILTLKQYGEMQLAGGKAAVSASNFESLVSGYVTGMSGGGAVPLTVQHGLDYGAALDLAKQGLSFEQIVAVLTKGAPMPQSPGPGIPGFASGVETAGGSRTTVGGRGLEKTYVPSGASLSADRGTGVSITNHFHVNGTPEESAQKIKTILMREAFTRRQFGTA